MSAADPTRATLWGMISIGTPPSTGKGYLDAHFSGPTPPGPRLYSAPGETEHSSFQGSASQRSCGGINHVSDGSRASFCRRGWALLCAGEPARTSTPHFQKGIKIFPEFWEQRCSLALENGEIRAANSHSTSLQI